VTEEQRVPFPVFEDETTDVISLSDAGRRKSGKRDRCTVTLLTGVEAGLVYSIDAEETVLGRGHGCRVRIEDSALSRRHCRLLRRDDGFVIEDMGSTNGTFVDGEPVREPRRLEDGVRIQMGRDTVLKFSVQDELEMRATQRLYESAMHDPLTGVYNRRYLDEHLKSEFAFAARHGSSLSLLLIDADHFKRVNDEHGHLCGDELLRSIAKTVSGSLRQADVLARFGGEELIVFLPHTDPLGALDVAERIRERVQALSVTWRSAFVSTTVSVGVAPMRAELPSLDWMIHEADTALYAAKSDGRNCVRTLPFESSRSGGAFETNSR
jgi:diguanylate cyclase (GGDEF)-like protein